MFIWGDLNGHMKKDGKGFERVHTWHGYGEDHKRISDFTMSFDLLLGNACFIKNGEFNYD